MLVQYKDPSLLTRDCPLGKNIQYRVLAISCSLEGDYIPYALIWDPETTNASTGVAKPTFTDFNELEIIDSTTPEDWKSNLLSRDLDTPTLVYSFDEMLDIKFYIRVHDTCAEQGDLNVIREYLQKYGGNIILSETENTMRSDDYITARDKVEEYLKNSLTPEYKDGRPSGHISNGLYIYNNANVYMANLLVVVRVIIDKIASLDSENSQRILADKIRAYSHMIDSIERIDEATTLNNLKEIYSDFLYPYDLAKIVDKAKNRKYLVQQV